MNSPNKALDRTVMSAVSSVIADSWPVAALMAVGQLGRWAPTLPVVDSHGRFVRWLENKQTVED
jgi:hypothetical protein